MKFIAPTTLALALAAAFPAAAQSNAELLQELRALKDRVADLERKLQATGGAAPAAGAAAGQWGMTPEQARELNRIAVKAEALQDNFTDQGYKGLKISGYMDPTFIWNKAQDRAGAQFLNKVESDLYNYDNSYFGAVVLDFQKETEAGTKYRLTLAPNRGVGSVFDTNSPVHEASVSVPITDLQTRFIAGQIPDWSGYEYLQPTLNKLVTHNLLFDFTLPTAYTGAGFEITRGKWIVKSMIGNMNKSMKDAGNKSPVLAYRVDYSRGEFQGFGFAGVHGKAVNFNDCADTDCTTFRESRVDLFEVDGYFIRGDWTVQGQLSYGQQKRASVTPGEEGELRDSRWTGLSGLVAYKFTPRFEGTLRGDHLRNRKNGGGLLGYTVADSRNGIGPGVSGLDEEGNVVFTDPNRGVNRSAFTLGLSYLWDLNTTFKVEYRIDRASEPVFLNVKDGSYTRNNQLFGATVLVNF